MLRKPHRRVLLRLGDSYLYATLRRPLRNYDWPSLVATHPLARVRTRTREEQLFTVVHHHPPPKKKSLLFMLRKVKQISAQGKRAEGRGGEASRKWTYFRL